jgi:hypothetical protein
MMFINIKPRTETGHDISVFVFYCLFDILKFQDFSVEIERDCSYDSLSVFTFLIPRREKSKVN